jgi:hypothetical protein
VGTEKILPYSNKSHLNDIVSYTEVADVDNVFALDMENKDYRNFKMTLANATTKDVTISNVPTNADFAIEVHADAAPAITWFSGITWLAGSAPTIEADKLYSILMMKRDTDYFAAITEGWSTT